VIRRLRTNVLHALQSGHARRYSLRHRHQWLRNALILAAFNFIQQRFHQEHKPLATSINDTGIAQHIKLGWGISQRRACCIHCRFHHGMQGIIVFLIGGYRRRP